MRGWLKPLVFWAVWLTAIVPILGIGGAVVSGLVVSMSALVVKFVIDVIDIYRDPNKIKPDDEFFKYF